VFSEFDVPGYLGMLFATRRTQSSSVSGIVRVRIRSVDGAESVQERTVLLFRPLVVTEHVPAKVRVEYDNETRTYALSERIKLLNKGEGTAVVFVEPEKDSDFQRGPPEGVAEFRIRFLEDLSRNLDSLSLSHPKHKRLISAYYALARTPLESISKKRAEARKIGRRLERAFRNDEDLLEDFGRAIAEAYLKHLDIITDMTSFLGYLNSVGEGRVILWNALETLRAEAKSGLMRLKVHVTDLGLGRYPDLDLPPFLVQQRGSGAIPIHTLFEWQMPHVTERRLKS